MDLHKIIQELLQERKKLDQIVASLEQLKLSGKPSGEIMERSRRGRKSMDAKAREEVSERMKRYWASRRNKAD